MSKDLEEFEGSQICMIFLKSYSEIFALYALIYLLITLNYYPLYKIYLTHLSEISGSFFIDIEKRWILMSHSCSVIKVSVVRIIVTIFKFDFWEEGGQLFLFQLNRISQKYLFQRKTRNFFWFNGLVYFYFSTIIFKSQCFVIICFIYKKEHNLLF